MKFEGFTTSSAIARPRPKRDLYVRVVDAMDSLKRPVPKTSRVPLPAGFRF